MIQLADDTLTLAEFIAMFLYSKRKYQVPNVKKTYFAHFSEKPIGTPMLIGEDTYISSIDEKKGYVYLGMIFLPTDDLKKILLANINDSRTLARRTLARRTVARRTVTPTGQ